MGDPYKGRLAGHVLLPSGPGGFSFCSCGAKTGPVDTFKKQREWHREHKAEVIDAWVARGIDDRGRAVRM